MSEEKDETTVSAQHLNEEQEETRQDSQVEQVHPDAFARKQYESDKLDPDSQEGVGNNPTAAQGGVGQKTEDLELDPSQQ